MTLTLFSTICLDFESIKLEIFTPFILQSIAASISLIIGLSNRNASISERTRSKATELLKSINEKEKHVRRKCLFDQMKKFNERFELNQIALFMAWTSLFVGLFIEFILIYIRELEWILTKLCILIIGLLSYSFLVTLWDIILGSKTLAIELDYVEKIHKENATMIIILMGVSGSGKTTVSRSLASVINWEYHDADDFHSLKAKTKMAGGESLTDEDRTPWLLKMQASIEQWLNNDRNVILACSALKKKYRQILRCDDSRVKLVYLKGSYALLHERLMKRQDHFMKAELLQSQLETLEEPSEDEAIVIDISKDIPTIVQKIKTSLLL